MLNFNDSCPYIRIQFQPLKVVGSNAQKNVNSEEIQEMHALSLLKLLKNLCLCIKDDMINKYGT